MALLRRSTSFEWLRTGFSTRGAGWQPALESGWLPACPTVGNHLELGTFLVPKGYQMVTHSSSEFLASGLARAKAVFRASAVLGVVARSPATPSDRCPGSAQEAGVHWAGTRKEAVAGATG